jgi:23S rRNA (guanosine2251-2'-O)-methyltransferase
MIIYGINAVSEALKEGGGVEKVILAHGKKGETARSIVDLARKSNVPVEFASRDYIDSVAEGGVHQGVIGVCRPFAYAELESVIANRHPSRRDSLVLILDGINDPRNLGSLIRTAHCFGANGVIIPTDRTAAVTAAVVKSSSGAVRYLPVARVVNIASAIDYLKEQGFWIYGADMGKGTVCHETDYKGHVGLVVGNEGRGIRPLIRTKCDFTVFVPMFGKIDSLNVSVAAAVIMYEIIKK